MQSILLLCTARFFEQTKTSDFDSDSYSDPCFVLILVTINFLWRRKYLGLLQFFYLVLPWSCSFASFFSLVFKRALVAWNKCSENYFLEAVNLQIWLGFFDSVPVSSCLLSTALLGFVLKSKRTKCKRLSKSSKIVFGWLISGTVFVIPVSLAVGSCQFSSD